MLHRFVLAFALVPAFALAQQAQQPVPVSPGAQALQQPTMIKQDDAIVALYRQISDAYAVGRRALDICQTDAVQQLAELRRENEELKKQLPAAKATPPTPGH